MAFSLLLFVVPTPSAFAQDPQEKVHELIGKLGSDKVEERDEADRKLRQLGPDARDAIKKALESADPEVRERARRILDQNRIIFLDKRKQVKLELVWIAPGKFTMGSNDSDSEKPPHMVTITKGFWMGATEVTQSQWTEIMGSNPSDHKGGGDLPVVSETWNKFQEFLAIANRQCDLGEWKLDLPTEAEWEYACRAGSKTMFSFAEGGGRLEDFAWFKWNSDEGKHPVAQKKPNAWGLYDMHGNVWEICKDWYGPYGGDATDPKGPDNGTFRVMRGGSWSDAPDSITSGTRSGLYPTDWNIRIGARVMLRWPR